MAVMPPVELPVTRREVRESIWDTLLIMLSVVPWWCWVVIAIVVVLRFAKVFRVLVSTGFRYAGRSILLD